MKLLNLGCGQRFHKDWTNLDFSSNNENVISCNLLKGIPFGDNEFNVVYHSHLLEHFSKNQGENFMKECYRVLKPEGILRIAVPDLEQIVKEYLNILNRIDNNDLQADDDYNWIMLEIYDQAVRNNSGGMMGEYIYQPRMPNE
jgi:predicted SAM-dependent methyltransferase